MKRGLEIDVAPAAVARAEPWDCLLPELWLAHILPNLPVDSNPRTCVMLRRTCRWLYANVLAVDDPEWPPSASTRFWTSFDQEVAALIADDILTPLTWFRVPDDRNREHSNYIATLQIPLRLGRPDVFAIMVTTHQPWCLTIGVYHFALMKAATEAPDEERIYDSLVALRRFIVTESEWIRKVTSLLFSCIERERYTAFECLLRHYFDDIMSHVKIWDLHKEHIQSMLGVFQRCRKNENSERWWTRYWPLLLNEPRFAAYWKDDNAELAADMRKLLANHEEMLKIKQSL